MQDLAPHRLLLPILAALIGLAALLGACDNKPTGAGSQSRYESAVTADSAVPVDTGHAPLPPSARSRPEHKGAHSSPAPGTTLSPTATTTATTTPAAPSTTRPTDSTTTVTSPSTTASPPHSSGGCRPGFVCGHVTAIGDSVMLDAQPCLEADVPGIDVEAQVSRQWYQGVQLAQQMRAGGTLGSIVVIDLGTNGPVTPAMFQQMMSVLSGASVVVFVTVHLPQSYSWWQSVNETLEQGVPMYPHARLANFNALADQNPGWFGSDGVHMPIGGPGAQAMASLIASTI